MRIPDTETGEFMPGNPATGKPGSMLSSAYMNSQLRELKNILASVGVVPDSNDEKQLLKAIKSLQTAALQAVGWASTDAGMGLADLNDATHPSGAYYISSGSVPNNWMGGAGVLLHRVCGSEGFQLAQPVQTDRLLFRARLAGNWKAPVELASQKWVAGNFPRAYSISALPTTDVGPITVIECSEVWSWVSTQYFTGYRSPLCGRPVDGHTVAPLASEVDGSGGLLSKTVYPQLWGYARENGLVVAQATWDANLGAHYFVDVNSTQFRVPDERSMVRRYSGTNADTATTRSLGSRQGDAMQKITGTIQTRSAVNAFGAAFGASGVFALHGKTDPTNSAPITLDTNTLSSDSVSFDTSRVARTSSETRGANVAFHPRIHI